MKSKLGYKEGYSQQLPPEPLRADIKLVTQEELQGFLKTMQKINPIITAENITEYVRGDATYVDSITGKAYRVNDLLNVFKDDIIEKMEKYYNETPKEELLANAKKISDLGFHGPTMEEYLEQLGGGHKIIEGDKVNSILTIIYKTLNNGQIAILRDELIRKTKQP